MSDLAKLQWNALRTIEKIMDKTQDEELKYRCASFLVESITEMSKYCTEHRSLLDMNVGEAEDDS